mmetsp:Transcript_29397/g.80351  ORF Transcript_29397/g.80351 Transcript_29397/m.80351 type:complete len:228 (+) Transcript_29397:579-1262(+)
MKSPVFEFVGKRHLDMDRVPQVRLEAAVVHEVLPGQRNELISLDCVDADSWTTRTAHKMDAADDGSEHQQHQDVLACKDNNAASETDRHDLLFEACERHSRACGQDAKASRAMMNHVLEKRIHDGDDAKSGPAEHDEQAGARDVSDPSSLVLDECDNAETTMRADHAHWGLVEHYLIGFICLLRCRVFIFLVLYFREVGHPSMTAPPPTRRRERHAVHCGGTCCSPL